MPLYDYKCPDGHSFEAIKSMDDRHCAKCPKCGKVANQIIAAPTAVHGFKLGVFEHITDNPVEIGSKRQLKDLCEQHGCYAPGVLD